MSNQYQPELDFTHARENNRTSQKILDANRIRLSSQVIKVLKLLVYGYKNEAGAMVYTLDFAAAYTLHQIGDVRRRICDIEQMLEINVDRKYPENRKAVYSLNADEKLKATQFLQKREGKK